jgi:hypothetical protein
MAAFDKQSRKACFHDLKEVTNQNKCICHPETLSSIKLAN